MVVRQILFLHVYALYFRFRIVFDDSSFVTCDRYLQKDRLHLGMFQKFAGNHQTYVFLIRYQILWELIGHKHFVFFSPVYQYCTMGFGSLNISATILTLKHQSVSNASIFIC